MGKDSTLKQIRGQLRQIAKELLPDLLGTEMFDNLQRQMLERLNQLADLINQRLDQLDQKQKDFHSFMMRELSKPAQPSPDKTLSEEK